MSDFHRMIETPLDRAVDRAIQEENERVLGDPEAMKLLEEQGDRIREELEARGVLPVSGLRIARIVGSDRLSQEERIREIARVQAYLPQGYRAEIEIEEGVEKGIRILGFDYAGWTLDGYVIPRLASGLIWAEEIIR